MDLLYITVIIFILSGISFFLAIFNKTNPRISVRFISLGFLGLASISFILLYFTHQYGQMAVIIVFLLLAGVYYWLYRNIKR